jgi:hypothetical protein
LRIVFGKIGSEAGTFVWPEQGLDIRSRMAGSKRDELQRGFKGILNPRRVIVRS